jgi:hypothetical protein
MRCRPLVVLLVLGAACSMLPATAGASPNQLSIFHDEPVLRGFTDKDADQAMAEVKYLGADMVRTFVSWRDVAPRVNSRVMPAGFRPGDPDSPGYDWSNYDAFVNRAERNGLQIYFAISPPLPNWASDEPSVCPHAIAGRRKLGKSCFWKPSTRQFALFVQAVARRYAGRVSLYSLWNEPNLEHYLFPQLKTTRFGVVDVAAKRYRSLWLRGWRAIARHDPSMRNKVLFGETAAISSPVDTLRAALCLDPEGRPFRGRMRALQGCENPRRLPVGGFAHHPYGQFASGGVFKRSGSDDSLAMGYLGRLHDVIDGAARRGRIPPRREIYLSEFGFQSKPPDRFNGLSLGAQARSLNEADRLFYKDRRIRSVAQFELYDAPEPRDRDVFNTGLRFIDGGLKPAWKAYRIPLTVERIAPGVVEVWGQVRPAQGRVTALVKANRRRDGRRFRVRRVRTNRSGFFQIRVRRGDAEQLRYVLAWRAPSGELMRSRVARAGAFIRPLE